MIIVFIIIIFLLRLIFLLLNFLISEFFIELKNPNSTFECGIENNIITRIPFSIQFFLIGLIFIIFDLEVIILLNFLPFSQNYCYVIAFLIFFLFIFFGLLYE
jgi:NADH-ubiquinone oxidoreductase chain 3